MSRFIFKVIFMVLIGLPVIRCGRILGFFPTLSKSHQIVHCTVAQALAAAGHNVTVITPTLNPFPQAEYRHIQIETPQSNLSSLIEDLMHKSQPFYKRFGKILRTTGQMANASLASPKMQEFLQRERNSFDLLLLGYFMNDFHLGLGGHFQCPIVISFMVRPVLPLNHLLANPAEFAYVPSLFSGNKQPLNFTQRLKGFLNYIFERFVKGTIRQYQSQKYYQEHFPADRYPTFEEVKKNVSLVLTNHHHISQGPIRPNVPALIDIGGIQIKEKPDPLPQDIADILDNAKNGVIYFSFGSNVEGSFLSKEKAKIMFDVLSKVPHQVLWKWGNSPVPGSSKNIIYKSWLPQDDILAHPNVKLFITHGGQGSVVESQYHGVPMLAVPLFGDQPSNAEHVVQSGFGLRLDYLKLNAEDFEKSILEVITNPKYKEAVQRFSTLYRDRPMSARESTVYWVEYVLRHKGAKHLQSPAVHLNSLQLMSLDVIAFILAVCGGILWVFVKICQICCCGGSKQSHKKASKTKKNK